MLRKEIFVAILVAFFSLGFAGTVLAEPEEASYVSTVYDEETSSMSAEQGKIDATESNTAPAEKTKERLLCANFNVGEKADSDVKSKGDCKTLYGV